MNNNNLILPISILLGCIILGGAYFLVQKDKQESIERQLIAKVEQDNKEYKAKRIAYCSEIEEKERKKWGNVHDYIYLEASDACIIRYETSKKGDEEKCKKYLEVDAIYDDCITGLSRKRF